MENNLMIDFLTGKIDENNQYYTEDIFKQEIGAFICCLLIQEGIITEKRFKEAKEEFMKSRNEDIIKEIKKFKKD